MADRHLYTVGWVCALDKELVAAKVLLDEEHDDLEDLPANDNNAYVLGKMGKHNIAIATLPEGQYGLVNAATVARDMARSFPNIRFGLMVGIGGGAPSQRNDIRLGDVVVGTPGSRTGGVLQYDYGKSIQDQRFHITGHLNQSPQCLLTAISKLKVQYETDGHTIDAIVESALDRKPLLRAKYQKPDPDTDILYHSSYTHSCKRTAPTVLEEECSVLCTDTSQVIPRVERIREYSPMVHFGTIASANQLIKDAHLRDELCKEEGVLCFEMEAAGLMNHFPCLVVRGVCDYADTHKNNRWQGYAAMTAAAYAKDLLYKLQPNKMEAEKKVIDVLSQVNDKMDMVYAETLQTHDGVKIIQRSKHMDDIIKWLKAPDPSVNWNTAKKIRQEGSGQKLLQTNEYKAWKKSKRSPFFWLHGIPGCGKTILAATVIDDLQASQEHAQRLLYFFFDFTDVQRQSFENALRSLLVQIYAIDQRAQIHIDSLYKACQDGHRQPSLDALQRTLDNAVDQVGSLWIVIDALDECAPRSDLLGWIQRVFQQPQTEARIHLLATSRPEHDLSDVIGRLTSQQNLPITSDLLEADISNYVRARVREQEGLRRWRSEPDVMSDIEETLLAKANGMFRWVACQLDELEECIDRTQLKDALLHLPRTLDETYTRMLEKIPQRHIHHTVRLLQFLTYSKRPLSIDEAVDALAVDIRPQTAKGQRFDPKNRMPIPQEMTRYCSSLIVLTQKEDASSDRFEAENGLEVQLAHFSVKDYLTSNRVGIAVSESLGETSALGSMAEVCLSYIIESESNMDNQKPLPFSRYSAEYGLEFSKASHHENNRVLYLTLELLSDSVLLRTWLRAYDPEQPWHREPRQRYAENELPTGLYYASFTGMSRCVQMFIHNGADVNAQGGLCGNALQAASAEGHKDVVQLLLDAGADVNAQGRLYKNALGAASYRGHKDIVQLLLDAGADINAQYGYYDATALHTASAEGYKDIVRLLLNAGADINAQGGYYGETVLCSASERGHKEVVQLLLEAGADVNAQGGFYKYALQAASAKAYKDVVQLLLDAGADVNAQGGEQHKNALQAAAWGGNKDIMQLLVNAGADYDRIW